MTAPWLSGMRPTSARLASSRSLSSVVSSSNASALSDHLFSSSARASAASAASRYSEMSPLKSLAALSRSRTSRPRSPCLGSSRSFFRSAKRSSRRRRSSSRPRVEVRTRPMPWISRATLACSSSSRRPFSSSSLSPPSSAATSAAVSITRPAHARRSPSCASKPSASLLAASSSFCAIIATSPATASSCAPPPAAESAEKSGAARAGARSGCEAANPCDSPSLAASWARFLTSCSSRSASARNDPTFMMHELSSAVASWTFFSWASFFSLSRRRSSPASASPASSAASFSRRNSAGSSLRWPSPSEARVAASRACSCPSSTFFRWCAARFSSRTRPLAA
mmetsp:Transcript_10830/g.25344  ORF Transcript_10830/g.25344 Transcript_10830/m.25344 type:complete len:340 (-) Transcript_10830:261-1280(-)